MKNIKISLQYEPASMQDIVILSSEEERIDEPVKEVTTEDEAQDVDTKTTGEGEEALVDFHITAPVTQSLKGILIWSKIMVGCVVIMIAFEIFFMVIFTTRPYSAAEIGLPSLYCAISIGINGYIVWAAIQFNRKMNTALKFKDNPALAEAFRHQGVFFKWLFINILVTLSYTLLTVFI